MARKNKENKNMALSTVLRDEGDSSDDDYRRKRDKNNQVLFGYFKFYYLFLISTNNLHWFIRRLREVE